MSMADDTMQMQWHGKAAERAEQIRSGIQQVAVLYARAVLEEDWRALSYASVAAWAEGEFGPDRFSTGRRQEIVAMLTSAGYTQRKIAAAVRASQATVKRDQEAARESNESQEATLLNNRQRAARDREAASAERRAALQAEVNRIRAGTVAPLDARPPVIAAIPDQPAIEDQPEPVRHLAFAAAEPAIPSDDQPDPRPATMFQPTNFDAGTEEEEAIQAALRADAVIGIDDDIDDAPQQLHVAGTPEWEALRERYRRMVADVQGSRWLADWSLTTPPGEPGEVPQPEPQLVTEQEQAGWLARAQGDTAGARAEIGRRARAGQPLQREQIASQFGVSEMFAREAAAAEEALWAAEREAAAQLAATAEAAIRERQDNEHLLAQWRDWEDRLVRHVRDSGAPAVVLDDLIRRLADVRRSLL